MGRGEPADRLDAPGLDPALTAQAGSTERWAARDPVAGPELPAGQREKRSEYFLTSRPKARRSLPASRAARVTLPPFRLMRSST